jgi:hypothetical protein
MFEFTYISPPRVVEHLVVCILAKLHARLFILFGVHLEEVLGEHGNIFHTIPKRRDRQLDRVDSIVQVFAKVPVLYRFEWIAVRRTYQTEIRFLRLVAADAIVNFLLKDAQKFWLQIRGHFADLIKEQTASVRLADKSDLVTIRSRE